MKSLKQRLDESLNEAFLSDWNELETDTENAFDETIANKFDTDSERKDMLRKYMRDTDYHKLLINFVLSRLDKIYDYSSAKLGKYMHMLLTKIDNLVKDKLNNY